MAAFNEELLAKAKAARSVGELMALARENGVEITEGEAEACFARIHPAMGELSDEELDNVSGGGCGSKKEPVVCGNCGSSNLFIIQKGELLEIRCENCGYYLGKGGRSYPPC